MARRVQRPVNSCSTVVAPFLPYSPEGVGGRLAEVFSHFLVVGSLPRRFAHGVAGRSWGCALSRQGRPAPEEGIVEDYPVEGA